MSRLECSGSKLRRSWGLEMKEAGIDRNTALVSVELWGIDTNDTQKFTLKQVCRSNDPGSMYQVIDIQS